MKKVLLFVFIIILATILNTTGVDGVNLEETLEIAPVNQAFVYYLEMVKRGQHRHFTQDGQPLGYLPSPVDLSHIRGTIDPDVTTSYSTVYDLRNRNEVTPVKNQGECGSCWAFGTFASLESCLLPSENWDFSEKHLITTHGFYWGPCEGGNRSMTTAYLARWDGPLAESTVPYSTELSEAQKLSPAKHIQQVIFLPERANELDNNTIKYFVSNFGAVNFSYYHNDDYYNSSSYSYYYNGSSKRTSGYDEEYGGKGNHSIAIVGWNDNFSKNNFNIIPPGNGAFIAKNSWGTRWGQRGYFYISYYDNVLGNFTSFNNAELVNNFTRNYQYDPLGWTRSFGYNSRTAWAANIFTASDGNPVRAVGFYTTDKKVKYEIYIYKGVKSGAPRSGKLATRVSGSESYSGYHTVTLDKPVSLKKGNKFSVVIKFVNSKYKYPIATESPVQYYSYPKANKGQSFMDANGSGKWLDIAKKYANTNVCIKAFSGGINPGEAPVIGLSCNRFTFGAIVLGPTAGRDTLYINNVGEGTLNWRVSSNSTWLRVSKVTGTNSGSVDVWMETSGLSAGTYNGKLSIIDPNASNSPRVVTVTLKVHNRGSSSPPFGAFATPINGSTVRSSVPVTGWALDDVGINNVKIYSSNRYIGDAVFIQGARPDLAQAYPGYPMNAKAGWGYMLLTNFLPGGGNGKYIINARATDMEGNTVSLGSKTIYCDNANAVKPFGAIDTPTQGGSASGTEFLNWGWVLTPRPNMIPTNGSTITVVVDGVKIARPKYNIFRSDISQLFPGYANSDGAIGYYVLDTTKYMNGVHTIQWIATDNAGNSDGIGSRYFIVNNSNTKHNRTGYNSQYTIGNGRPPVQITPNDIPNKDSAPLKIVRRGKNYNWSSDDSSEEIFPDPDDIFHIKIKELEPIEIHLKQNYMQGYLESGGCLNPMPIGSVLDAKKGIFYWLPGPGFAGNYNFQFVRILDNNSYEKKLISIHIHPQNEPGTIE